MSAGSTGVESDKALSYATGWVANALALSARPSGPLRIAVASYEQSYLNYIEILELTADDKLVCRAAWDHCYPPTKIMFAPACLQKDYVISTADYLRLWEVPLDGSAAGVAANGGDPNGTGKAHVTLNAKDLQKRIFDSGNNSFCSPITSCDWSAKNPDIIGCSSIDTTVTIWDVETGKQRTQLVAHDREVYDIAFVSENTFVTCGADGSARLFDLRTMEHCTVLYETPAMTPLLRVAANHGDSNNICTFGIEDTSAYVVDRRYPTICVSRLSSLHTQPLNAMAWSPGKEMNICTVAEDGIACIWAADNEEAVPLFQNQCEAPINNVAWLDSYKDWIAVATSDKSAGLRLLRI